MKAISAVAGVFGSVCLFGASGTLFYLSWFSSAPAVAEESLMLSGLGAGLLILGSIYLATLLVRRLLQDTLLPDGVWLLLSSFLGMFFYQLAVTHGKTGFWGEQLLMLFLLAGCFFLGLASCLRILSP